MFLTCTEIVLQTFLLGIDAQTVIGLRMRKIAAGGPAAVVEAHNMVAEKIGAFAEAAGTLAANGSLPTVINRFRMQVQANAIRLAC